MELRQYWRIVYRRLWIVVLLPIIVVGASFLSRSHTAPAALANLRLAVGIVPQNGNGQFFTYDSYYSWLTAEYLADDLSEIVKSRLFADLVSQKLGGSIAAASIQGSTTPQKLHRILTVSVSAPTEQQAMAIAGAVAATLRDNGNQFLPQLSAQNAAISVIDPPALVPVGPSLKEKLDLPLRILLALAVGLGLVFLIDYLDDSVRDAGDLEILHLGVLAEIPK